MTTHSQSQSTPLVRRCVLAGFQYFAVVFSIGFLLGVIRGIWLEPRLGTRAAELLEAPLMLVAMVFAAKWVVRRNQLSRSMELIATGAIAFMLVLSIEFTVVLWLRGITFAEYVQSRDPVAGGVYILLLAAFGLMPLHCGRIQYK